MRKAELEHWLKSDKVLDLKHIDCALETIVEENVRKFLLTRLKLLIANYPTDVKVSRKMNEPFARAKIRPGRDLRKKIHTFFFYATNRM